MRLIAACLGLALLAAGIVFGALASHAPVAAALTPTPTPTAPPAQFSFSFANSGGAADELRITTGPWSNASVTVNAPGCVSPGVTGQAVNVLYVYGLQPTPVVVQQIRTTIHWPSACVDPGESVSVQFTTAGDTYSQEIFGAGTVGTGSPAPPGFTPAFTFLDSSAPGPPPALDHDYNYFVPPGGPSYPPPPYDALEMQTPAYASFSITVNAPGCGAPTITTAPGSPVYTENGFQFVPGTRTRVTWPTLCLDHGEFVRVHVTYLDLDQKYSFELSGPPYPKFYDSTLPPGTFVLTNTTGAAADAIRVTITVPPFFLASGLVVLSSPAGCGAPATLYETFEVVMPVTGATTTEFRWPTACISPGTSVVVAYALFPFTALSATPSSVFFDSAIATATPTGTPPNFTPTPTPQPVLALDCDTTMPGVQDDCTVPLGTTSLDVDVVFMPRADVVVQGFNFGVRDPDISRLDPPEIAGPPTGWDSNPDFNQLVPGINSLVCSPPAPSADIDSAPTAAESYLSCAGGSGGAQVSASLGAALATVHYDVPSGAAAGVVQLSLSDAALYDDTVSEIGSCPRIFVLLTCRPATIHLVAQPTATPTPVAPSVRKQPEGNAANADLSVPKANLWLCVAPATCAGMGEGNLRVVEQAASVYSDYDADGISDAVDPDITGTALSNTELGLGAYEFSVEYDNFVIQSVNPCDIVFGPDGAGTTRGPVDELNSSSPNPDCAPDPNSIADGTCSMSLVLENVIRFGCVTNGSTPYGPSGSFALASLNLIPHPDLTNDIFPGNSNGVITVLKDNGCELADVFGHPVAGSINGGLTPTCGDLAVTVRILEGDLNLDCKVDVTDEQLISFRYGSFFGDLSYTKWHDLEPALHDLDIDIKDLQKVFGRDSSTCQAPIPAQPPADPPASFG